MLDAFSDFTRGRKSSENIFCSFSPLEGGKTFFVCLQNKLKTSFQISINLMNKMEEYLLSVHQNDVLSIVKERSCEDIPFRALAINLIELKAINSHLFGKLNGMNIWSERLKWIAALNKAQEVVCKSSESDSMYDLSSVKKDFPVTFVQLPNPAEDFLPFQKLWELVQVKGNVVRTRERGKKEVIQEHKCRKCKVATTVKANRSMDFFFDVPKCKSAGCKGTMMNVVDPNGEANLKHFIDFQEIKIQPFEHPGLLTIELDEELVETCFVGDRVIICGTFETRNSQPSDPESYRIVLRAVSACVHEDQRKMCNDPAEMNFKVNLDWLEEMRSHDNDELCIRDEMIASVAPELDGLSVPKLGLLLVLCSGGSTNVSGQVSGQASGSSAKMTSATTREISHFLMIGDPGVGKSQLLKAASELSAISVRTVGYAATTAGLTAHCYRDEGDTQIEAGALVKANNGVCCIDEINFMSKEHRGSIHEVMEMQKITLSKGELMAPASSKASQPKIV